MRFGNKLAAFIAAFSVFAALSAGPAGAVCRNLGFTVNDYGKDGPTRDAKALLDKYIASWTAERGIKRFKKGKKTVSCFKFLDFGFFDEWTCKAVSKVCFRGPVPAVQSAKAKQNKAQTTKKAKKVKKSKTKKKKIATAKKAKPKKKKLAKTKKKAAAKKKLAKLDSGPTKAELAKVKAELAQAMSDLAKAEAALAKAESDL